MEQYRIVRGISSDLNGAKFKADMSVPVATIAGAFPADAIKRWLDSGALILENKPEMIRKTKVVKNG
jgi:hypothetical protein